MNKKYLLFILVCMFSSAYGQTAEKDTSWKSGGFIGINFTQVNLSQWSAGGENSLSLAASASLFSNYLKGKNDWQNSLDLVMRF